MQLAKLRKTKRALGERQAAVVTAAVTEALGYLHGLGIAHRDVKPANVVHDGQFWRVCDFGFAVACTDEKIREPLGTPAYSAPELVAKLPYVGKSVDMWALGVMLFEMVTGGLPFLARGTAADLSLRIQNGFQAALKSGSVAWTPQVPCVHMRAACALLYEAFVQRAHAHGWLHSHARAPATLGSLPFPFLACCARKCGRYLPTTLHMRTRR